MSRLDERVEPLERRQRQPEPNTALKLLTADELRRALALARGSGRRPAPRHHVLRRDCVTAAKTFRETGFRLVPVEPDVLYEVRTE